MNKATLPVTILAAALMLGSAAHPQGGPASPDPEAVRSGVYKIEPAHTQVLFSVLHLGFTEFGGVFTRASGELTLDPKSLTASALDVTLPVDSVSTQNATLDGELKGEQWFDTAKYPTLRFHSTAVTRTGADTADVAGDLTLHGVTRPVVLKARFIGAGVNPLDKSYTAGFQVTGVIKRSDFGVKTYVPLVGDDVAVNINAAFNKPAS